MVKENINLKEKLLNKNKEEEKIDLEFVSETSNPKAALFVEELLWQKVSKETNEKQINNISEKNLIKNNFNKNIVLNEGNNDEINLKLSNREKQLLEQINQLKYKNCKATISTSYEVIKLEEKLKELYEISGGISKFNRSLIYRKGLETTVKEIEKEIKLEKESWTK